MNRIIGICALLCASLTASAGIITTLLLNASATGAGTGVKYSALDPSFALPNRWFQATLSGASAISATVEIDGSADNVNWVPVSTIGLTSSVPTSAVQVTSTAPWMRGNITAISGTGETVTLMSGE